MTRCSCSMKDLREVIRSIFLASAVTFKSSVDLSFIGRPIAKLTELATFMRFGLLIEDWFNSSYGVVFKMPL